MKFSTGLQLPGRRLNPLGSVAPAWMCVVAKAAEELGYCSPWLNEFLQTEPNVAAR
jgi:alkanesulfonate monooxygenase SsuD/methylene tetrahydromethanopterin reductase-like flavin-dependent oxidoreductase (luciferase family)